MVVMRLLKVNDVNAEHPKKASFPMAILVAVPVVPNFTLVKAMHLVNAPSPSRVTAGGRVIVVSFLQLANAKASILVRFCDKFTVVRFSHPAKAPVPIIVAEVGNVMVWRVGWLARDIGGTMSAGYTYWLPKIGFSHVYSAIVAPSRFNVVSLVSFSPM